MTKHKAKLGLREIGLLEVFGKGKKTFGCLHVLLVGAEAQKPKKKRSLGRPYSFQGQKQQNNRTRNSLHFGLDS